MYQIHYKFNRIVFFISFICLSILFAFLAMPRFSFERAPKESEEEVIERAQAMLEKENYIDALGILLVATKLNPEGKELRELLYKTVFLKADQDIESGKKSISSNLHNLAAYQKVADAYLLIENRKDALEILLEGVTENPKATQLWANIGQIELSAGRYDEAISIYRELARLDRHNDKVHYILVYLLLRHETAGRGDVEEAYDHAQAALKIEPENPDYMQAMAEANFRKGNRQKALELIKQAIYVNPAEDLYQTAMARYLEE